MNTRLIADFQKITINSTLFLIQPNTTAPRSGTL